MSLFFIVLLTIAEIVLIVLVFMFFLRLKKSEEVVQKLQENQDLLLERVYRNAALEQELVATFSQRQEQLASLIPRVEERIVHMQKLLSQAEGITRSPQFLRELIANSKKKGMSAQQIAAKTGLSKDEVELIMKSL